MDLNIKSETSDREPEDSNASDGAEDERSRPQTGEGSNPGKIFVGGLARETTIAQFVKHFEKYGDIIDSVIMKDRITGNPRGFGFITYSDPSVVDKVMEDTHVINGKQVEIKRTIPKGASASGDFKTKKIFVGGIPTSLTEDEFMNFFSKFGVVKEHQIMLDRTNNRSRGFGFITFDGEKSVDDLLSRGSRLDMDGTKIEIKKAEPKRSIPLPTFRRYGDSKPASGDGYHENYMGFGDRGVYMGSGAYGGRAGGYGGGDYDGYGGYGWNGGGLGALRGGDPSFGYPGRYGGGFGRGYDMDGPYGGPESYDGYGADIGPGGYGGGYGSGYGGGGSFGARAGYGNISGGGSRYHPYAR